MELFEHLALGFGVAFTMQNLIYAFVGCLLGTLIVVLPGIASYKCVNLQFAVGYSMKEFTYIADQMDKGHVDPKAIISNAIALDQLPAMMATLRGTNEETKVHVRCG